MMRRKEIILGLCFFHFSLLMSSAVVAVDGEDEVVSESNHQKNNSSQDITENINNTLLPNATTTTVAPRLPLHPKDISSASSSTIKHPAPVNTKQEPLNGKPGPITTHTQTEQLSNTDVPKRGVKGLCDGYWCDSVADTFSNIGCSFYSCDDQSSDPGYGNWQYDGSAGLQDPREQSKLKLDTDTRTGITNPKLRISTNKTTESNGKPV